MDELIINKVLSKDWTFQEIAQLHGTIDSLSNEIVSEISLRERFDLIKELRIKDDHVGMPIEQVISELVLVSVKVEVAEKIRIMLNKATVNFGGNKNEVSERNVGGKSHKKRTTDEKNNSEE